MLIVSYNGSVTVDAATFTSAGSFDVFVLKMSTVTGATMWAKTYGGTQREFPGDAAIDGNGNVVIVGDFSGAASFNGNTLTSAGSFDGFLLKVATDGAYLSSKRFGGSGQDDGAAIAIDSENNLLVLGGFATTSDFGCAASLVASESNVRPEYSDIFLAKYTQAGACVWVKGFGGTGATGGTSRQGFGIGVNAGGDVGITGAFCGSISLGGQTLTSASICGKRDVFAARFDADGVHLNSVRAGGTAADVGHGVAQDTDGRLFVIGNFEGLAEFGGNALTAAGGTDAFVVGLAPL